ncbi:MAG: hypothetical protein R2749_32170 [Acidimicrobiales bacterium]
MVQGSLGACSACRAVTSSSGKPPASSVDQTVGQFEPAERRLLPSYHGVTALT